MKGEQNMKPLSLDELEQVTGGTGAGAAIATGSFASNSGTNLNILVSWSAFDIGGGLRKMEIAVSSTSYSLDSASLVNGVDLAVNGTHYTANSAAVSYHGNSLATSPLASFTVQVPGGAVNLSVTWNFKGSYGGVALESITASGTATV